MRQTGTNVHGHGPRVDRAVRRTDGAVVESGPAIGSSCSIVVRMRLFCTRRPEAERLLWSRDIRFVQRLALDGRRRACLELDPAPS